MRDMGEEGGEVNVFDALNAAIYEQQKKVSHL